MAEVSVPPLHSKHLHLRLPHETIRVKLVDEAGLWSPHQHWPRRLQWPLACLDRKHRRKRFFVPDNKEHLRRVCRPRYGHLHVRDP